MSDEIIRRALLRSRRERGYDDSERGWWASLAAPDVDVAVQVDLGFNLTLARNSFAAIEALAGWVLTGLPVELCDLDALGDDVDRIGELREAALELERLAHGLRLVLAGTVAGTATDA